MKFPSLLKTSAITGLAVVTLVGGHLPAVAADANYILNTASTGGTYHPVGTAIATLTHRVERPNKIVGIGED